MLVEGLLFIYKYFTALMREESCLHLYGAVAIARSSFRLGCTLLQAAMVS